MRRLPALLALTLLAACSGGEEGTPDGGTKTDGGSGGADVEVCQTELPKAPAGSACVVTAGGEDVLLEGDVLVPGGVKQGGGVIVGADGKISCAGCDCASKAQGATKISCPGATISPAFVNAHDHITFTGLSPAKHTERFEHRHDWRKGKRGHTKIPSPSTPKAVAWGELRQAISGTTSLIGSGGAEGLLRNLDGSGDLQEGLGRGAVKYSTFPLGDSDGTQLANGCAYPRIDDPSTGAVKAAPAYVPHVAEGIDAESNNEFACVSGLAGSARDLVIAKAAFIHGVGLKPQNYATMAADGTALIWSPRSNVDLYGMTAEVTTAARFGVEIALGTDWTASGSMNMLRELRCADGLNQNQYGKFFTDRELVDMATIMGARVAAVDDLLGSLEPGKFADIAIFAGGSPNAYRAVLAAEAKDVLLVLRGGRPLAGEPAAVDALGADGCEAIDICSAQRKVCAKRETGKTVAELKSASGAVYDLFFCGPPKDEPSCVPMRPQEFTGVSSPDDTDGDGVANATDNCASVFNPARPLDGNKQSDVDGDGKGDACDTCPTSKDDASCPRPRNDDADFDDVADATDNCKSVANKGQEDRDQDKIGDACDECPDIPNGTGEPCPSTIYALKRARTSTQVVIPDAVVTAVGPRGYFIQHAPGDAGFEGADNSGIFVYTAIAGVKPPAGARVSVKGEAADFFGQVQLTKSSFTLKDESAPVPPAVLVQPAEVATGGARAEALEGVLVRVEAVTVSNAAPEPDDSEAAPTNEFELTGGLRVNDYMFLVAPAPSQGDTFIALTGVLRFANAHSKLEPRFEDDVVRKLGLSAVESASPFVAVGSKVQMTVKLTSNAAQEVTVALVSADAALEVPTSVKIPQGARSATFEATGKSASAAAVKVTASYDGVSKEALVRPYDPAAPRALVAFESDKASLAPGQSARLTARIDLPAAAGGTKVDVTAAPAGLVTLGAAQIDIAEGAFEGSTTAAHAGSGSVTITAKVGSVEKTLAIETVAEAPAAPPVAGELVITEVMANPKATPSEDAEEWIEVFNASTHPLALDGIVVEDNGAKVEIQKPSLVLAPGAYGVFACSADAAKNGGVTPIWTWGSNTGCPLKFGNSGDFVRLSLGATEIDKAGWGTNGRATLDGRSMCLLVPYADNSKKESWGDTAASVTFGPDGAGSPGAASTADNCKP